MIYEFHLFSLVQALLLLLFLSIAGGEILIPFIVELVIANMKDIALFALPLTTLTLGALEAC
jgi:hypothetical protein